MPRIRNLVLPLLALVGCTGNSSSGGAAVQSAGRPFEAQEMARFNEPWAMTFLPGRQQALITERPGRLLLWEQGKPPIEVSGVPQVAYGGQGGLGDVVLHPGFAQNGLVYLSWVEAGPDGTFGAVVGRGRLLFTSAAAPGAPAGVQIEGFQPIWRQQKMTGRGHFSHRIAFGPDGKLFISSGERQAFTPAQDPNANLGRVVRLNDDGSVPADNPFAARGGPGAQSWTMGNRNLLGLAFAADGNLWEIEMGPQGGDELNLVGRGLNYGYPNASNGSHYDGRDIPDHRPGDGYEPPKVWWNPSISPSSLMIYSGNLFPQWRGDAFVGALSGEALIRIDLDGTNAVKGDQWPMGARIREVEQGPDGAIYVLEDGDNARLLRLTPTAASASR
jgi:glucose/arabinose dehydrogenase